VSTVNSDRNTGFWTDDRGNRNVVIPAGKHRAFTLGEKFGLLSLAPPANARRGHPTGVGTPAPARVLGTTNPIGILSLAHVASDRYPGAPR
jgi:hypothetical protein